MRRVVLITALAVSAIAQRKPVTAPIEWKSAVEEKNFYLLAMIERDAEIRRLVHDDPALSAIAGERAKALEQAVANCKTNVGCFADAMKWKDPARARDAIANLYGNSPAMRDFVEKLRDSGMYVRYNDLESAAFLARAWTDAASGIDRIIDVYGLGVPPRYPQIDSPTYDPKTPAGAATIANIAAVLNDDRRHLDLFFLPSLRFALELLDINLRDEAGRLEPMDKTVNAAALRRIALVEWRRYPYTAIVVPGSGNDRPGVRISPGSKLRCQLAATRFHDGKAPFIIVSGGFVHPNQTPFAEAIEMKRELMEKYAIPGDAIIVDPHARHTTTNLRNAARLMYRYGMPFEAPALITTDASQSAYIQNPDFKKRCLTELGYVPHRLLRRQSPFDLEFVPLLDSLQSDPQDPLDP